MRSNRLISLLFLLTLFALPAMSLDENPKIKDTETAKFSIATFRAEHTTSDDYHYLYTFDIICPANGASPEVRLYNPSLPDQIYTIEKFAGSLIRKELWLKDRQGEPVSMVIIIEEAPGARNAMQYRIKLDRYPGKRSNQKHIDAIINSQYNIKDSYSYGRFLFMKDNSGQGYKKAKAGGINDLFNFLDSHLERL